MIAIGTFIFHRRTTRRCHFVCCRGWMCSSVRRISEVLTLRSKVDLAYAGRGSCETARRPNWQPRARPTGPAACICHRRRLTRPAVEARVPTTNVCTHSRRRCLRAAH